MYRDHKAGRCVRENAKIMSRMSRRSILSIVLAAVPFLALSIHLPHPHRRVSARMMYFGQESPSNVIDVVFPHTSNGRAIAVIVSRAWKSSSETIDIDDFPLRTPLLSSGYTLFFVSHRSLPVASLQGIIMDIHRAIRFIRFNMPRYGLHSGKIGVLGVSSGGHLALMLASTGMPGNELSPDEVEREPSTVQAVVAIAPVSDLPAFIAGKTLSFPPRLVDSWDVRDISPVNNIHKNMSPTIIMHGDFDVIVPVSQSMEYVAAATTAGSIAVLDVLHGQLHSVRANDHITTTILQWYNSHLF